MFHDTETIAAIASGLTTSGIGIIRISGPEAFDVAGRVARLKCGKPVRDVPSHSIRYGVVVDPGAPAIQPEVIDEALFMIMRGPATYTAEDTVEINCHGGPAVMRKVLQVILRNGARAAEPGEFTKRAFLNGRIDLSEAEAVMDVIDAKNEEAIKSAVKVLRGSVRREIEKDRALLLTHIARIEASLDDPEHLGFEDDLSEETGGDLSEDRDGGLYSGQFTDNYLEPERMKSAVYRDALNRDVTEVTDRLSHLLSHYDEGRLIREGIRTVILGKPNAGKSSLYNLLAGQDRAIVTDIAGTTRDVLEETVMLGGMTLILTDTAGIRETNEPVEKIGVERARKAASEADLILFVADATGPLDDEDLAILQLMEAESDKRKIALINKTDLLGDEASFRNIMNRLADAAGKHEEPGLFDRVIAFSATEATGYEELSATIRDLFMSGRLSMNEEVMITSERQRAAAEEALQSLGLVRQSLDNQLPEDFYAIDLMDAYTSLGRIIGADVGEDVVNEVFSRFCMGK